MNHTELLELAASCMVWLCLVLGFLLVLAGVLAGIFWVCQRFLSPRTLHMWWLAVAMRLHGKQYRDDLLWRAIRERAEFGPQEAKTILKFSARMYRTMYPLDWQDHAGNILRDVEREVEGELELEDDAGWTDAAIDAELKP